VRGGKIVLDFSKIAKIYDDVSVAQTSAGEKLLKMLDIKEFEDVLDLGCGTGKLTAEIRKLTRGRVVGVDVAEGIDRNSEEER
jgi:ubiquinone/menaquinone biosynthesis C-methylase UbiE